MFRPKTILAPTDFSVPANDALATAAEMATQFGAALVIVNVVPAMPKLPPDVSFFKEGEYEERLRSVATRQVSELTAKYAATGLSVRSAVGIANDVGMEILRTADHQKADLVVIASHGAGWNRLPFGSVAEKVVQLSSCAVLVLRARSIERA